MRKRVISVIMALVMCFGLAVPFSISAQALRGDFVIFDAEGVRIWLSEQPISYTFDEWGEGNFTVNVGTSFMFSGVSLGLFDYPAIFPRLCRQ